MNQPNQCLFVGTSRCPPTGECPGRRDTAYCTGQLPEPGIFAKAASFAAAVVHHVSDGCREAPPEVQAERERICRACPLLDQAADRCTLCGCYMPVKRAWASSSCPDVPPRWDAYRTGPDPNQTKPDQIEA